jgi:hypothetical protein
MLAILYIQYNRFVIDLTEVAFAFAFAFAGLLVKINSTN